MMKIMLKEKLKNLIKKGLVLSFVLSAAIFFVCIPSYASTKAVSPVENVKSINKSGQEIISIINKYQDRYFEITKRRDVLLNQEDIPELNNDRKELEDLFKEVENKITNKCYLKKYKNIQKRFSNCEDETTTGINNFAENNYKAINVLLNKVYKKATSKLDSEALEEFVSSENNWEKEVEDYQKVYNSMDFGTLGTSIYYTYEINMREFRTLLLMLCL